MLRTSYRAECLDRPRYYRRVVPTLRTIQTTVYLLLQRYVTNREWSNVKRGRVGVRCHVSPPSCAVSISLSQKRSYLYYAFVILIARFYIKISSKRATYQRTAQCTHIAIAHKTYDI